VVSRTPGYRALAIEVLTPRQRFAFQHLLPPYRYCFLRILMFDGSPLSSVYDLATGIRSDSLHWRVDGPLYPHVGRSIIISSFNDLP